MFAPVILNAHNPGPMTAGGNNTYLLAAEGAGAALVDAGVGDSRHLGQLDAALTDRRARLRTVLVTHAHIDHAGGAPALASRHPGAAFVKLPWPGEDERYAVAWSPLADGDVVDAGGEALTALHTPGHSPDHLAFWHEASRTIFTGDLVIPGGSVMIQRSRGGDLAQYLRSLDRLIALEPQLLLPAHGPRVEDACGLLRGHIEHRLMREHQIVGALRAGAATVQTIAESIYHGLDPALMAAARENVRAHLEKLRAEGRASNELDRWRLQAYGQGD